MIIFLAGACCAITASYQATPLGFSQYGLSTHQSIKLIKKSVILAKNAKDHYLTNTQNNHPLIIAGSVGPYGAYLANGSEYTGNYQLSDHKMNAFHQDRLNTLIEAGVDIIAFETMPSFSEIKILINLIKHYPNTPCWFSFTLKDSHHLSDGTPLYQVMALLNQVDNIVMLGVNCIAIDKVNDALKVLKKLTSKTLLAYPR